MRASFGQTRVRCSLSGIGKVNAALAASALVREGVSGIVNIGVAGALDASLSLGDVVICSETLYHDVWCGEGNLPGQVQGLPARFAADGALLSLASSVLPSARLGACLTGDRFITEPSALEPLRAAFPGALCVDMEAAAIAQVCHLGGVPFISIKIVSDGGCGAEYEAFWAGLPERAFGLVKPLLEAL